MASIWVKQNAHYFANTDRGPSHGKQKGNFGMDHTFCSPNLGMAKSPQRFSWLRESMCMRERPEKDGFHVMTSGSYGCTCPLSNTQRSIMLREDNKSPLMATCCCSSCHGINVCQATSSWRNNQLHVPECCSKLTVDDQRDQRWRHEILHPKRTGIEEERGQLLHRTSSSRMYIYCNDKRCPSYFRNVLGMNPNDTVRSMLDRQSQEFTDYQSSFIKNWKSEAVPLIQSCHPCPPFRPCPIPTTERGHFYGERTFPNERYNELLQQDSERFQSVKTKRFQCLYCDKSFGKSSHLRDHVRTHTGERPFSCSFCGKAFTQYSNLRTHVRIHTGEKPYQCKHCSKSFTQAVTLKSHLRTHGLSSNPGEQNDE